GVHTMLVQEVDRIDPQAPERTFGSFLDVRWSAVEATPPRLAVDCRRPSELRRDTDLSTKRSKRFSDQLFVGQRAIDLGRIEERNASIHGRMEQKDHLLPVRNRAVGP